MRHTAASRPRYAGTQTLYPVSFGLSAGAAPLSDAREDTRLMFQEARLLPWKKVIDNVGLTAAERRGGNPHPAPAAARIDRGRDVEGAIPRVEVARDGPPVRPRRAEIVVGAGLCGELGRSRN